MFITPGILIMTVASVALGTAIATATDMTTGIIARFRTMDIARVSVLTGHVLGAVIKTGFAVVIVTAFAFALGFRSDAGPLGWLGAIGLLILIAFSLPWLTVGLGLAADSVETASNTPLFLVMLPFISSGFVPTGAMPTGLRQFAEYQPFTPMIDTLRAPGHRRCDRLRPVVRDRLLRADRTARLSLVAPAVPARARQVGHKRETDAVPTNRLTIGQLASYASVTVRAVRHYHAKGLLPEPERDHSGYRRYDAHAAVELIKIRTLADAGVPLARPRVAGRGRAGVHRGRRRHRPALARGDPGAAAAPRANRPAGGRGQPGPAAGGSGVGRGSGLRRSGNGLHPVSTPFSR